MSKMVHNHRRVWDFMCGLDSQILGWKYNFLIWIRCKYTINCSPYTPRFLFPPSWSCPLNPQEPTRHLTLKIHYHLPICKVSAELKSKQHSPNHLFLSFSLALNQSVASQITHTWPAKMLPCDLFIYFGKWGSNYNISTQWNVYVAI